MPWKKNLPKSIKDKVEEQIKETLPFQKAYTKAKRPATAQLWVALGNLAQEFEKAQKRILELEQQLVPKKKNTKKDFKEKYNLK